MSQIFLIVAAILGGTGVMLGAFASHGLKSKLSESLLSAFETGVTYQFYHALALFVLALWLKQSQSVWFVVSGYLWLAGVVLFSGSLYALALTGVKWFGPITPIGGVLFIAGWVSLLVGAIKLGAGS
ncbi:MAG TPA: DUF423 domain-containing protein [Idiomarina loihiensis]|jgi:uncharacterized membrane protein YgdD (TMEM256/DUF423 family)|uniref:Uncharacterized conserved membrane protein n=1 Tax=Idiomarina loihiensis (strain ATCC BAA-735 / DSM 15497 / L2-TR) TaxID=283942 RepID=Q5QW14_IDILO|nr:MULTISPECIES: DUF423 domain-containing protein [Idiomarina]AAV81703.1 Uncharacterized conserved membrane protein [Idiomarina loihiensis L2TR]AGM35732.1 hypothetical protein K734_04335 [Idiomarina loihiensis GSL 199]HAS21620.1 DUF423 domain-containing protein [Idiomarina loihiensis]|tara:strand:- start:508 stop:888 length:381 start_codon:yes stop_codon:yes gene_type:complete